MKKIFYTFIFSTLMGWEIRGSMDPAIKKSVLIVMPHTSWHDFYVGLFARGIIGLDMHYVAKKELFGFSFGWFFRWMGGVPIDRSGNGNKVDAIAEVFCSRTIFRMAIAPEGTRKKVAELKTGFYYIALKANVPIIPVAFDYGKKKVVLFQAFYPTGNVAADMQSLIKYYLGVSGKIPENDFNIHLVN